jgi:biotin-(acetyl-CoA carboxylase) ligase
LVSRAAGGVLVNYTTASSAAIRERSISLQESDMTVKANNSAAWLAEVEKRVARIKTATGEAALHDVRELIAAAQILRDELAVEVTNGRKNT